MEDAEYIALINEGMTGAYIRQKEGRAREYSIRHGVRMANVLREWWYRERKNEDACANAAFSSKTARAGELGCSFDTDDFVQAAIEASLQPW